MKKKVFILYLITGFLFLFSSNQSVQVFFGPSSILDTNGIYFNAVNFISKSTNKLYLAIHELELINIALLLVKKSQEGVHIEILLEEKWTTDPENQAALDILYQNKIKVHLDKRKSGLMHNKYIIRDGNSVWTGSANFTLNGFFYHHNDVIIIRDRLIAKIYEDNFYSLIHYKQYYSKLNYYHPILLKDQKTLILPYFSRQRINSLNVFSSIIDQAKTDINFLIFAFSSSVISAAIEKKLKQGIKVRGIFDNQFESENILKNWKYVPFQLLWQKGADVRYDEASSKVHHKCMVIDNNKIITGSFNFSKAADTINDENFVFIQNAHLTKKYKNYFNQIWLKIPDKTPFEDYTIYSNRIFKFNQSNRLLAKKEKNIKSYSQYFFTKNKKQDDIWQKTVKEIFNNSQFLKLKVNRVLSGNQFWGYPVTENKTLKNKKVIINLYGLSTPKKGNHKMNQQPQASYVLQDLNNSIVKRTVFVKIKMITLDNICHGIVYLKKDDLGNVEKSINANLLSKGMGILNHHHLLSENIKEVFQEKTDLAKSQNLFLHGDQFHLAMTPNAFEQQMIEHDLKIAELELKYSMVTYKKNAIIGNRKTKKYYNKYNGQYWEYIKNLSDSKLIFFEDSSNAKKAGYKSSQ